MKQIIILPLLLLSLSIGLYAQRNKVTAKNKKAHKVATGFAFTEGPSVASDGKVYFTDQPRDQIHVWDQKQGITLFMSETERSNGTYFNKKGQLVACADLNNRLIFFDEAKKRHVIHQGYQGVHLNGPNDLWPAPNGDIYFTDPYYHRKYWKEGHQELQQTRGVYLLKPSGEIVRVIDDFKQPNGIIGTPDGQALYVADINDQKIWKYSIQPDGTLSHKTLFAPKGSDGMTIDNRGNVYLTYQKVWIYSPEGQLIEAIELPEKPSNVCFGGKKRNVLFITARTSVYTLKMKVKGVD